MSSRMVKLITNNFGYKLLAFFLACALWLVVYNLDDPNITKSFSTNVTVINADALTEMNKCYEIAEGGNSITFSVTGQRSYVEKLVDTNFTAVADMENVAIDEGQESGMVPISISCDTYNRYLTYNGDTKYLQISVDDLMKKRFAVTAGTSGEVAEGYALGEVAVSNPTVIQVSGPKELVSEVVTVKATIDVTDMTVNISDNVVPVLLDAEGKEVDTTRLTLNNSSVTISAKILSAKEVSLVIIPKGNPAEGYYLKELKVDPEKISLKGTAAVLNKITEIEIPEEVLSIDKLIDDVETTIDITEYLPEGVELIDGSQQTIKLYADIEYSGNTDRLGNP